jgi:hypothetical protein
MCVHTAAAHSIVRRRILSETLKKKKFLKVIMARSMACYHGPCEDDLEMAIGGHRLEKSYSDFISLRNPEEMRFLPNSITVTLFPVAHSQFSNHHNFIKKKISIGPDFKCIL